MSRITAGQAVKHVMLPGILPRLKSLFFNGFSLLAYYVAVVYGMAKILPANHPYLAEENIGRFGMRHVIAASWRNLEFKWKNIDRILFFFAVLSGIALTLVYVAGAAFYLFTTPSLAAVPFLNLFTNDKPDDDIAFMMMDKMLEIPGIFDSKIITAPELGGTIPSPFHVGLHALFAYYSYGIFVIAVVMFLYFIVEIVLEMANTGTPFGRHFENIWVPIRLIVGIGLLIPIAYGMNSAQWITLYAAKFGSNFATNAWTAFNESVDNALGLQDDEMIGLPVTPDFTGLAKDLFTMRACRDVTEKLELSAKAASAPASATPDPPGTIVVTAAGKKMRIDPYFVDGDRHYTVVGGAEEGDTWPTLYNSDFINIYLKGLQFYNGGDVKIVFGRYDEDNRTKFPGGVEPVCGEVVIPNLLPPGQAVPTGKIEGSQINEGILIGASDLYAILNMMYGISKKGFAKDTDGDEFHDAWGLLYATDRYFYQETSVGQQKLKEHKKSVEDDPDANPYCMHDNSNDNIEDDGFDAATANTWPELGDCRGPVSNEFFNQLIDKYQRYFSYGPIMGYEYYTGKAQEKLDQRCSRIDCGAVTAGAQDTCQRLLDNCNKDRDGYAAYKPDDFPSVYWQDLGQEDPFKLDLLKYGWGGAGIWYKILAEKNGRLTGAAHTLPRIVHLPMIMEYVGSEKGTKEKSGMIGGCERYNPGTTGSIPISQGGNANDAHDLATMYYRLCTTLQLNENIKMTGTNAQKTGNPLLDVINALFGTSSLFNFRENQSLNPMAQLAALGRALIDKAIENIMISTGGSAVGGLLSMLGSTLGHDAGSAGALASSFGELAMALSKMLVGFAMTGLLAGILLFYVIPFLPFMYFFFAVGTWVKTVFEALVGVPLWALAHLRIEGGPGFSGQAASGGYVLLLEIFLRPIVTLFALAASTLTFMALAYMLNATWGLVTGNLVGYDSTQQISTTTNLIAKYRPQVDQFFFTIIYVIFMYITATGSFKLIDQIPDGIMRWLSPVKTFGPNDSAEEMVGHVTQTVGVPVYQATTQIIPSAVDFVGKVPRGIGGTIGEIKGLSQNLANAGKPSGGT